MPSEPETHTGDPARLAGISSCYTGQFGSLTKFSCPFDARIGRKLAGEFVPETQACHAIGQPPADIPRLVVLAVQIDFNARLQDESLRKQQLVFSSQTQGGSSALAHIGRGI